jgi:NAD+ diphosphatase
MTKLKYWFIFQNEKLLLLKDNATTPITSFALPEKINSQLEKSFTIAKTINYIVFSAELKSSSEIPEPLVAFSFRKALEILNEEWYSLAVKSFGILMWDKNHHFCGRCGNETTKDSLLFERHCRFCSLAFYPRISPSIIVRIHKDNEILMARSPHFAPGAYGFIAGFIEIGEPVEEAVHREVLEEVGIKIKNLRYFGSQAWPFPDSLMIAFTADYESGNIIMNQDEIEDAGWYGIDNLPGKPSITISMASKLLNDFISKNRKESK